MTWPSCSECRGKLNRTTMLIEHYRHCSRLSSDRPKELGQQDIEDAQLRSDHHQDPRLDCGCLRLTTPIYGHAWDCSENTMNTRDYEEAES